VSAPPLSGERFVTTHGIRVAVRGHETDILDQLGIEWERPKARPHINCPYRDHADNNPSWRWDTRKRKAFCTCGARDVLGVLMGVEGIEFDPAKIRAAELLDRPDLIRESRTHKRRGGEGDKPPEQRRNSATPTGCRLADYAEAKRLPTGFLHGLGLAEIRYEGAPAVKIPYLAADGAEAAVRFRIALDGRDRFRWRKGSKACLYGLNRLADAVAAGCVVLVEGESDAQTLWLHQFPALGSPGAGSWNEQRDAPLLAQIACIYVVIEPDQGGDAVLEWLRRSSITPRVRLVRLQDFKDPSALYIADPGGFRAAFLRALAEAESYEAMADRAVKAEVAAAREAAGELLLEPDILGRFASELERAGLVGEETNAKVLYLALTSRLFDRPVSVAVKGVSSGGKSFTLETVLRFMPREAYWSRTAMSERALAYSDEDFRHRFIVIYEAAGMASDFGSYLIRSLLSEGGICYELVQKTKDGMRPRLIEKDGPTGLIVTTTATRLHPENETRLLSLNVKDTPAQTAAVMLALARGQDIGPVVDYARWQALQKSLEAGERRVVVPFAPRLAELVPPVAVRLRRDFRLMLTLIHAHALLQGEGRERDDQGRIVASLDDYAAVREMVADLFAEGVDATVKPETRDAVAAVKALGKGEVSVTEIAKFLTVDTSTASRRVRDAVSRGYLANNETGKGRPARIALGDPMPNDRQILPHPDDLVERCTLAALPERIDTPSLPFNEGDPAGIPAFAEVAIE
jgi:hypothetical protein